jgi:hypothetical protein
MLLRREKNPRGGSITEERYGSNAAGFGIYKCSDSIFTSLDVNRNLVEVKRYPFSNERSAADEKRGRENERLVCKLGRLDKTVSARQENLDPNDYGGDSRTLALLIRPPHTLSLSNLIHGEN